MSAVHDHDDPRALFPTLRHAAIWDFDNVAFENHENNTNITMRRCAIPGEYTRHPMPMMQVETIPPHLAFLIAHVDLEDNLQEYRTHFWFRDRAGYYAAWRLSRIIARGLKINEALVNAIARNLCFAISDHHEAEDLA